MEKKLIKGKIIVVYFIHPMDFMKSGVVLQNPVFVDKGKNSMLKGKLWIENKKSWAENRYITINLDAISAFIEVDSLKGFLSSRKSKKKIG